MAPLLRVPRLLEEMGVDPDRVIADVGVDPELFDNPENVIPFVDLGRFLALRAKRTHCPHFGLLLGRDVGIDVLGLTGQIARQLLRDTRRPMAEIAAALDYSGTAAFDRAFRRWSGTSPTAWRAVHIKD